MNTTTDVPVVVMNLSSFLSSCDDDIIGEDDHNQLNDLESGSEDKTSAATTCTVFTEEDGHKNVKDSNQMDIARQTIAERSVDGSLYSSSSNCSSVNVDGSRRFSLAFAKRPGKTLSWSKVNMEVKKKTSKERRVILDNVYGSVPEKEVTAIMGPSGCKYLVSPSNISNIMMYIP